MRANPSAGRQRQAPVIRSLEPDECTAILARNHVGRLAYALRDRVDIEPVHYVHDDGWLYGRTSHGAKLATLQRNPWVAFEVDEVHALFDWSSVVVKGSFHLLDADGPPREHPVRERALELLRTLVPATLDVGDPTPWRDVVFRIAIDEVSGREARPGT